MASVKLSGPIGSLARQAVDCQERLQKLFEEAEQDENEPAEWVGRQMAEFNVWCAKLGVKEQGHRLIDFRLKDVPEICEAIGLMLQSLRLDLDRLSAAAPDVVPSVDPQAPAPSRPDRMAAEFDGSDSDSGDSGGSNTSLLSFQRLSSPEGSTDDEEMSADPRPGAAALRRHVEDTLDRLHGLARQVQTAGAEDRQKRIDHYRTKPGPSQVYALLRRLASEKLQHGAEFRRASDAIKERMAESFARRRMRFIYMEARRARRGVGQFDPLPETATAVPPNQGTGRHGQAVRAPAPTPHLASDDAVDPAQDPAAGPEDRGTLYTMTENTKLRGTPEMRQIDKPETVASVTLRHRGFPKPPDITTNGGFECPYCRLQFPAREADIDRWSHHVIQDFEPYFCIFEKCDAPFDVPNSFEGLLVHMHGHMHEQWHIETPEGHRVFEDERDFERYIRDQGDIPELMLPTMVEFSRRRGALLFDHCAFCGGYPDLIEMEFPDPSMPGAQEKLRKHIKQHLHDIALFLPPDRIDQVDDKDIDDGKSESLDAGGQARSEMELGGSEAVTTCGREDCDCRRRLDEINLGSFTYDDPGWQRGTLNDDSRVRAGKGKDADFWRGLLADSPLDISQAEASYNPSADRTLIPFLARARGGWECPLCMDKLRYFGRKAEFRGHWTNYHLRFVWVCNCPGRPWFEEVSDHKRHWQNKHSGRLPPRDMRGKHLTQRVFACGIADCLARERVFEVSSDNRTQDDVRAKAKVYLDHVVDTHTQAEISRQGWDMSAQIFNLLDQRALVDAWNAFKLQRPDLAPGGATPLTWDNTNARQLIVWLECARITDVYEVLYRATPPVPPPVLQPQEPFLISMDDGPQPPDDDQFGGAGPSAGPSSGPSLRRAAPKEFPEPP